MGSANSLCFQNRLVSACFPSKKISGKNTLQLESLSQSEVNWEKGLTINNPQSIYQNSGEQNLVSDNASNKNPQILMVKNPKYPYAEKGKKFQSSNDISTLSQLLSPRGHIETKSPGSPRMTSKDLFDFEKHLDDFSFLINKMKKTYKRLPKKTHKEEACSVDTKTTNGIKPTSNNSLNSSMISKRDTEQIHTITNPFSENQLCLIRNLLEKEEMIIPQMEDKTIKQILDSITYICVGKGVTLYSSENKTDNVFYMVEKGKLGYLIDDEQFELEKYDSIGTKALKKNCKENCKLFTIRKSYLFCLPVEKYKTIVQEFLDKNKEDKIEILRHHFFFNFLDKKSISDLALSCSKIKLEGRKEIIGENKFSPSFFLVIDGVVLCLRDNNVAHQLGKNELFGEMSLFTNAPNIYSYIGDKDTTLIEIPTKVYLEILGEKPLQNLLFSIFSQAVKQCSLLNKNLAGGRLNPLFSNFTVHYGKNEVVSNFKSKRIFIPISGFFQKQTPMNSENGIHVPTTDDFRKGAVNGMNGGFENSPNKNLKKYPGYHIIQVLPENESIPKGELYLNAILTKKDDNVSIYSSDFVILLANWNDIIKSVYTISNRKVSVYSRIQLLKSLKICRHLSELKLFLLSDALKIQKFKDKSPILKNGPISPNLYIIKSGEVKLSISNTDIEVQTLNEKMSFGDITSSPEKVDISLTKNFDFVANGPVECFVLSKESYIEIVENYNSEVLNPLRKLFKKDKNLSLESFYYLKEIGAGTYGKVYLVHNTKNFFAMKAADIQALCGNKVASQYYLNEKSIMQTVNHPFIVQLLNTYRTPELIFFLMEYVEGLSLRDYVDQKPKESYRNNEEIIFFGGILFIVLNYLQKFRIIHRDLKPENLMIDDTGFLKVIDFGIAKDLCGKDSTHTLIGTPHFMAPEIILGKRYGFAVDYWSVGIILYLLFYGHFPFGEDVQDTNKVFSEITEKKLTFPSDPKNNVFNQLVKELLYKNPNKRLSSFSQIKSHSFFEKVDFDTIYEKKIKPIYIPQRRVKDSELLNKRMPFYTTVINRIFALVSDKNLSELKGSRSNLPDKDYLSEF